MNFAIPCYENNLFVIDLDRHDIEKDGVVNFKRLINDKLIPGMYPFDIDIEDYCETLIQENGTINYEKTNEPQGGKFAILDDSLQFIKYTGSLRPKPQADISDNVHNLANYGFQGLSPNRRYLADCISAAQILTLYELKEGDMQKKWEYVVEELDYVPTSNSTFVAKSKEGYSHASLTNEFVYALLVGEAEDDEIGHYEREIHVFDIQTGELVAHYLLDRPTRNFLVKDGKLYTIPDSSQAQILVYDLK